MEDQVLIFDTTLRDGEQSAGVGMTVDEKLEIARQLDRLGVDVIEAGFPISSPGDFEAVRRIALEVRRPIIAALAHANPAAIDRAAEALKDAAHPRIHVFISSSDQHIQHQLRKNREEVVELAAQNVARARKHVDDVEFSPMDSSRTEKEFLAHMVRAAVEAGATTVNIPDTVGYAVPEQFAALIQYLREQVPQLGDTVRLSIHCHDDLGMSVANSLAAVKAGARQVEGCINGIGERAGNTALEEVIMALRTRQDYFGVDSRIDTTQLYATSRLVSQISGFAVQPNKAVIGRNAFRHASGIHQDGVLKERTTYEIMDARDVGLESNSIVLGKHSGRHALRDALEQLGFKVDGQALNDAFRRFKEIADRKKQVTALDLEAIVSDQARELAQRYELGWFEVEASSRREPHARVGIVMPDGSEASGESSGDGPVDAIFGAIAAATGVVAELRQYTVSAVTGGEDALGEVTVMLRAHDRLASGQGVATDIIEASARAYVRALSNALDGAAIREAEGLTADAATQPATPGP